MLLGPRRRRRAAGHRASAGADAQYGSNETWDFYKTTFNRDGIFGNGTGSYNRVHYGSKYVNAFWDGTKMTYGYGDGVSYSPLVSHDVAGHEMSLTGFEAGRDGCVGRGRAGRSAGRPRRVGGEVTRRGGWIAGLP